MNERVRELASQCWDLRLDGRHFDQEQFAELIVRECIDIVHQETDDSIRVAMAIETHFGVEE